MSWLQTTCLSSADCVIVSGSSPSGAVRTKVAGAAAIFDEAAGGPRLHVLPGQVVPGVQTLLLIGVEAEAWLPGSLLQHEEPAGIVAGILAGFRLVPASP